MMTEAWRKWRCRSTEEAKVDDVCGRRSGCGGGTAKDLSSRDTRLIQSNEK
jgi:hypothetical protein